MNDLEIKDFPSLDSSKGISFQTLIFLYVHFSSVSIETVKRCKCLLHFKLSWQGNRKSFQLAIIMPQENLIGYDAATAQSYIYTF